MGVIPPPARSAFPGAKSIVDYDQISRKVSGLKGIAQWGINGVYLNASFTFTSPTALFQTKGFAPCVPIYIVGANPPLRLATTITNVLNETTVQVADDFGGTFNACR